MVTMLRPAVKVMVHMDPELADDSVSTTPATAPEVMAIAGAVCEFMNREHLRDVANYVVHFGRKFVSLTHPPPHHYPLPLLFPPRPSSPCHAEC